MSDASAAPPKALKSNRAEQVYAVVGRIPYGRVTTYGTIAEAIGLHRGARQVGWILHGVATELDLPCHRVVNSAGFLSGGWHFGHPEVMRSLLVEEGVPFRRQYHVDLKHCLWRPETQNPLPAADEVDDLDPVAGSDSRGGEERLL